MHACLLVENRQMDRLKRQEKVDTIQGRGRRRRRSSSSSSKRRRRKRSRQQKNQPPRRQQQFFRFSPFFFSLSLLFFYFFSFSSSIFPSSQLIFFGTGLQGKIEREIQKQTDRPTASLPTSTKSTRGHLYYVRSVVYSAHHIGYACQIYELVFWKEKKRMHFTFFTARSSEEGKNKLVLFNGTLKRGCYIKEC